MAIDTINITKGAVSDLGKENYIIQILLVCLDDSVEVINTSFPVPYLNKTGKDPADVLSKTRLRINDIISKYNNALAFRAKAALDTAIDGLQTQVRDDNGV